MFIPNVLSLLIFLPIIAAFGIVALGPARKQAVKWATLGVTLVELGIMLLVAIDFVSNGGFSQPLWNFSYRERSPWVPTIGATYSLGMDGLSFPLLLLNAIIFPLATLFAFSEHEELHRFFGFLLAMEGAINGVFLAQDFFLFYIFWEAVLIPMFFLIHGWGGANRRYAAMKFFIYTHVASVVMFIGFLMMYFQYAAATGGSYTFSMEDIGRMSPLFPAGFQSFAFVLVFFGFAVKMPMVPFHTWLPDAHVQAPTAGSVILAAMLLKMGGYGLIRIAIMMLPGGANQAVPYMAALGAISMVYGALVCLRADDLKRLIAVSSVSHMGFVLLAASTLSNLGIAAAVFQMFTHGLISAMLFMMAGAIGHNVGTRNISQLGGIQAKVPRIAAFTKFAFLASLGLPALAGFASELPVFFAAAGRYGYWVAIPLVTVLLTACYYLWAIQRAFDGPLREEFKEKEIHDLKPFEMTALGALAALIVLFGILPFLFMDYVMPFATALVGITGGPLY